MPSYKYIHKFELKPDRWVFVPTKETISRGRTIKEVIESRWTPPDYYAHLLPGGHISAIKKHLGNTYFIRADINQFFNQINKTRITRELKELLKNYSNARAIACESVVLKPNADNTFILPFGFVQSPIIASICLYKSALGKYIDKLHKDGTDVSVYMDDIIISSSSPIDEIESIFQNLKDKALRSKFDFNADKTIGPTETISAFNVNLYKDKLEVTNERLIKFEEEIQKTNNDNVTKGIINYVNTISYKQAEQLKESIENKKLE